MAMRTRTKSKKSKFVQVYMTDEEFTLLEQMSNDAGISKTEYMRRLFNTNADQKSNRFTPIQLELQTA
jgi:hypothetical protein